MKIEYQRPPFLTSYFEVMKEQSRTKGWGVIFPAWLIAGFAIGGSAAYSLPDLFWQRDTDHWAVAVSVYVGILTLNGLVLALSWSAFSRIHDALFSSANFAAFLRHEKLLASYLFYIDYVQVTQLIAVCVSAIAIFTLFADFLSTSFDRLILMTMLALSAYAIKYAVNAVSLMQDLVWQKSIFDEQNDVGSEKIVRLGPNGNHKPRGG